MKQLEILLNTYGESHMNPTNKLIHWICVPLIMFSLFGLLYAIPFFIDRTWYANWAMVVLVLAWIYYLRLSYVMLAGFVFIGLLIIWGVDELYTATDYNAGRLAIWSLVIFVIAWIGQFIGHKIEGKKPSFLHDVQFFLIGPAWLMSFVFKRIGVQY